MDIKKSSKLKVGVGILLLAIYVISEIVMYSINQGSSFAIRLNADWLAICVVGVYFIIAGRLSLKK